tara:strand:+ start:2796 stop:3221 length:426 start_codon:yes stop_codon:yes gene_type:complete
MCDYIINRRFSDQAKILSTAAGILCAIPISVVGVQVDLVLTEPKRPSGDLILADTVSSERNDLHAKGLSIEVAGGIDVLYPHHEMVDSCDFDHGIPLLRLYFQGERCRNWTLKGQLIPTDLRKSAYQMDFKLSGDTIFDVI